MPQDIQVKIIAVAKNTLSSERALALINKTGALIYWQDANDAQKRIQSDRNTLKTIDQQLKNK